MKRVLGRASGWTALPLALALGALGVREITRPPTSAVPPAPACAEYQPPLSFLALTGARGAAADYVVDRARSLAQVIATSAGTERRLLASGTVHMRADDEIAGLELDLALPAGSPVRGWPTDLVLHVRGAGARSHAVLVPGVRAANVRCSVTLGREAHEAVLDASWIHLPGGEVELHGVVSLAGHRRGLLSSSPWRMLDREDVCALGIDLVLRTEG